MCNTPVRNDVFRIGQEECGDKIDVRNALGKRAKQHGFFAQLFTSHRFADTGAQNDMCE